jgi:gamma-glutamyltranspeptidase/glutathione hydrolase
MATRPVMRGRGGMVAAGHPLAASVGLRVLAAGGAAADAAIAAAATAAVVQPHMNGLGGETFLLVYDAEKAMVQAFNGPGAAPRLATPERFPEGRIPLRGPRAATVPGAVDAWWCLRERFGTRPWQELLSPAIGYAADGFGVDRGLAEWAQRAAPELVRDPAAAVLFLPGGRALRKGCRFVQPDLAATLDVVARDGRDAFYRGPVARAFMDYVADRGGLLRAEDLDRMLGNGSLRSCHHGAASRCSLSHPFPRCTCCSRRSSPWSG